MRKEHIIKLVSKLLGIASFEFSNHGCNDLPDDFYEGMNQSDIGKLYYEFHKWNDDLQDFDPKKVGYITNNMLMRFLSEYIKEIL